MEIKKLKGLKGLIATAGLGLAVFGITGCASMTESRFYPKDYQGRPVGNHTLEMWEKTGEDISSLKTAYKAPVRAIGSLLTTVNDVVELPLRGVTNSLAQIPYVGKPFEWLDDGLSTTFDSTYGGQDMNNSLVGGLGLRVLDEEKKWYERAPVISFFANSYVEAGKKHDNKTAIAIDGTYKTAVKLASLIVPFLEEGEAGISPILPSDPGVAPF